MFLGGSQLIRWTLKRHWALPEVKGETHQGDFPASLEEVAMLWEGHGNFSLTAQVAGFCQQPEWTWQRWSGLILYIRTSVLKSALSQRSPEMFSLLLSLLRWCLENTASQRAVIQTKSDGLGASWGAPVPLTGGPRMLVVTVAMAVGWGGEREIQAGLCHLPRLSCLSSVNSLWIHLFELNFQNSEKKWL